VTRHQPVSCQTILLPFLAAVVVGIAAWQCVRPAAVPDAPPATAMSTPTLLVILTDPIPRLPSPPTATATPEPTEAILRPTSTPVPPSGTPSPTATSTPTIEATKRPMEQKG
jgi:hypothetical protein